MDSIVMDSIFAAAIVVTSIIITYIIMTSIDITSTKKNKYDIVVFHYPCNDGLASAWIVYYFYGNIELYPFTHGDTIDIKRFKGKRVLFCDICPKEEILNEIEKVATKITILDHHASSEKLIKSKSYGHYDKERSGAGMTWDFFFPGTDMPLFIKMIQDGDLWKWTVKDSKNFISGFDLEYNKLDRLDFEKIFKLFNKLLIDDSIMDDYIRSGLDFNEKKTKRLQKIAREEGTRSTYNEQKMWIRETEYCDASELGNMVTSGSDVDVAVLYQVCEVKDKVTGETIIDEVTGKPEIEYHVSLRSCGNINVFAIAKLFGGGGHMNAAGFATKTHPLILLRDLTNDS